MFKNIPQQLESDMTVAKYGKQSGITAPNFNIGYESFRHTEHRE